MLTAHEITVMFLAIGLMLTLARIMGELARKLHQPTVLGEILAGVILGPTVLGMLAPRLSATLFPLTGPNSQILQGLTTLSAALFLLVAGMELDLSTVWRQGRTALCVGLAGIVVPFALGFGLAGLVPASLGHEPGGDRLIFSLFLATALSISALPVIARTLLDLNIYQTDLGMIIVAAAIFNDLVGWIIFALILSLMGGAHTPFGLGATVALTLIFAALMLTAGRWAIHHAIPWLQAYTSWPGSVLGLSLGLALLGAAFTEWIGVHAIFGSFLAGIAIGDSSHLREQTRKTIDDFVSFFFAPLFFASIGLRVNFITAFDLPLTLFVLAIACAGKLIGCGLGARLSGMTRREALAVGFGLNARGAMEIILGLLALQFNLIGERLFVALVVMALVTSLMSGPAMQKLLLSARPRRLTDYLTAKTFLRPIQATRRREAITELAGVVAGAAGLDPAGVEKAIWTREQLMPTGLEKGLAIPHARLAGLEAPVVGLGLSEAGIDFDSPDGELAQLIFLILSPQHDNGAQLEILADIARTFNNAELNKKVLAADSYTKFLALLRSELNGHEG